MASPAGRLLAALVLPLACGPASPHPSPPSAPGGWISTTPGADAAPAPPAHEAAAPEPLPAPAPWERAPELPSYTLATPRARSQHFTGELEAEVRVNPAASPYPRLGPARPLPPGAILVESHYRPGGTEPVALLAMMKHPPGYDPQAGDWEYLVVTPAGEATQRGRLPLCQRCHAEAPHDHLFGGPRAPR